jgi:hypothetical protein
MNSIALALTPVPPKNAWSLARRTWWWAYEQRWFFAILLAAFAVRLEWNIWEHPPGDYIYSDMNGYVQRADRLLANPTEPSEYAAFFPYGTHLMIALTKAVCGKENYLALAILYALLGALAVAFAYAAAKRASRFSFLAPAVGLFGVFYYPHFSLGGYLLSEVPFCTCLMGALVCALRLADHGRKRDAILMGIFAGLGTIFRPQMLLSVALVGLFWIVRRKALPNIRLRLLLLSAIPLAVFLGLSVAHMKFNTGRWGVVSDNGSFNLVFGRCHNSKIESLPDGQGHGRVHFRPPEYLQTKNHVDRSRKAGVPPEITLDPAIGDELSYKGYIGDRKVHMGWVKRCVEVTGWKGQLEYSWTNVRLLWEHNIPWPDSGNGSWRPPAQWWTYQHKIWLAIPALLGLLWMFVPGRRAARLGLVGVNLLAEIVVAAIYFGGTRHRAPYDFVIIILAFETYATAAWLLLRGTWWSYVQALRQRGGGGPSGGGAGAGAATDSGSAPGPGEGKRGGKSAQNSSSS